MKKVFIVIAFQISFIGYSQQVPIVTCSNRLENINANYSKAKELQAIIEELVKLGVPGASIAVYSPEGWWASSAGFAKIEDKTLMQPCHLLHLQSIAKTYMAVSILKLVEQEKIDLNQPITKYLPTKFSNYISTPGKITVKMLLNHTSGVPEYNFAPAYVACLLQHPTYFHQPVEYLKYTDKKPLDFAPGSKYSYRNTNYVLLSMIADAVTGDHAKFIRETIFNQLGLTQTFYRGSEGYINYPTLVNSYWDRHSDGVIENVTMLQNNNVASLVGDDGIVTTPIEAIKFLKDLLEEKIISKASLDTMKTWVNDKKGNPTYGLGLDYATFAGHNGYGHSGGGIGAGCQLYYFPDKDIYVFAGINLGTITESPLQEAEGKVIEKIYSVLLK
jgi:D-alanyl-D-alanine carboxypeptidase